MAAEETPGLDPARLADWLQGRVELSGPLSAEVIAGGKSNLTYVVTDGTRDLVVRRPPLGHVLATAHDMGREYRVMSALQDTDVPVPRMYAHSEDDDVLGAPFYVMERVEGVPYRTAEELRPLGPERTRTISEGLVDTLVALHEVVPEEVGLGDFGRPDGFLERQLRRWSQQLESSRSRDLPDADTLRERLAAAVPDQSAPGIVHGDFRLDNILTDDRDRPAAVIDWEMATLGDPLTDLALMVLYHRLAEHIGSAVADASNAPGFLSEEEVLQRYNAASSRDLGDLDWYLGLAAYKLAVILEGIHYRHSQGQTVGSGFDRVGEVVPPLLATGLDALKER